MEGTIKKYFSYRGYGFIELAESEKDIFFHSSNFQSQIPKEKQKVMFRTIDTPKGKEAVDIRIIQSNINGTSKESDPTKQISLNRTKLGELNGIGPKYKKLLEVSGIQSIESLSKYTPEMLLTLIQETNEKQGITTRPPTLTRVNEWINTAKNWK
jgi:cold shock CspA family protein